MERFRIVESKRSKMHPGGLKDWVENEKWVDIRRKNKKGGYEPCGRNDTSKGKKPVCVPSNKAKNLTEKEKRNRKRQKARKEREPNPDKKPNTTKYTEQAGGKSNVSDNHNIRFVGSTIPLSELRPKVAKFVKVSEIDDSLKNPPFEIPASSLQDERENIHDDIKDLSGNHGAIQVITGIYKALEDNLYEMGDKRTIDALKTLEINSGNERFDNYYHSLMETLVNSMNEYIDDNGTFVMGLPEDNPKAREFAKRLQKAMLGFMLNISSRVNIFNDKNYEYFLLSMLKQTIDVEADIYDSI